MQTITINNEAYGDATEATVFGPFFVEGSPDVGLGGDIAGGAAGEPCWVEGTVTDTDGTPARRRPHRGVGGRRRRAATTCSTTTTGSPRRGHLFTDDHGRYRFWAITPTPYPIPDDGPVGRMLAATGRSPMRAVHLHFMVVADGHRTLVTHIFVARRRTTSTPTASSGSRTPSSGTSTRQPAGTPTPDGRDLGDTVVADRFDIVLAPARTAPTS